MPAAVLYLCIAATPARVQCVFSDQSPQQFRYSTRFTRYTTLHDDKMTVNNDISGRLALVTGASGG